MENIDIYYESIKQIHEEVDLWEETKEHTLVKISNTIFMVLIILLISSVFPLLPITLSILIYNQVIELSLLDSIASPFFKFGLIWLTLSLILGGLTWAFSKLSFLIADKYDKNEEHIPALSSEQYTFIFSYKAYNELKKYLVSHLDQHIDEAKRLVSKLKFHWKLLRPDLPPHLLPENELYRSLRIASTPKRFINYKYYVDFSKIYKQQIVAKEFLTTFGSVDWIEINEDLLETLSAITTFIPKISSRLENREDLSKIYSCLENFSKFSYAIIPSHRANFNSEEYDSLIKMGHAHFRRFVREINELPLVEPDEDREIKTPVPDKKNIQKSILSLYSRSLFFRFFSWFIFLFLLTFLSVIVITQYYSVSSDTMATLIIAIIGTSVAGAVGIAGFLPQKKERDSHPDK